MTSKITVQIEDLGELDEWVSAVVHRKVQEQIEEKMDEAIAAAVQAAVEGVVTDRLQAQALQIVEEGWQTTDSYGRPTGQKKTLRDMMTDALTAPTGDHYSSNRAPFVQKVIEECIRNAIQSNFAKDIAAAQAQLKSLLDAQVKERLATALKQALGLPSS